MSNPADPTPGVTVTVTNETAEQGPGHEQTKFAAAVDDTSFYPPPEPGPQFEGFVVTGRVSAKNPAQANPPRSRKLAAPVEFKTPDQLAAPATPEPVEAPWHEGTGRWNDPGEQATPPDEITRRLFDRARTDERLGKALTAAKDTAVRAFGSLANPAAIAQEQAARPTPEGAALVERTHQLQELFDGLLLDREQMAYALWSLADYIDAAPPADQLAQATVHARAIAALPLRQLAPRELQVHLVVAGLRRVLAEEDFKKMPTSSRVGRLVKELLTVAVPLLDRHALEARALREAGQQALAQRNAILDRLAQLCAGVSLAEKVQVAHLLDLLREYRPEQTP